MSERRPLLWTSTILFAFGAAVGPHKAWGQNPETPPAEWPQAQWNPKPAEGDLILPMPCGGKMAFRKVATPALKVLDDKTIKLGSNDPRYAWSENTRSTSLAGGFSDPAAQGQRHYWIGKYEVSELQYASLGKNCPTTSDDGRMPKIKITWAEATMFVNDYTKWLIKRAPDVLAIPGGGFSFIRLPTETEWEFAARGGIAVSDSEFAQSTFPMPDGVAKYVWYQSSESSNNELNPIGLLKPNPLGLHDILGNVAEFVLDPFRLNKVSQLHGQAGAAMVKGGDYRTSLEAIRSSARDEFVPVDKRGERREPTVGFRAVLVTPDLPERSLVEKIRENWKELHKNNARLPERQEDPVMEVESLAKFVEDESLKVRIQNLSTVIKSSIQAGNEQRGRAAKSEIRVGSYLARQLADAENIISLKKNKLAELDDEFKELRQELMASIEEDKSALDFNIKYYRDTITHLTSDYQQSLISEQATILKLEMSARNIGEINAYISLVTRHSQQLFTEGRLDESAIMTSLTKLSK